MKCKSYTENFVFTVYLNPHFQLHLARIKYNELVVLYKSSKNYEKNKAIKYYNLCKPFSKIAYREQQYFIAIKELKSMLKVYPKLDIAHFGLALFYGLLSFQNKEIFFAKRL